MKRSARSEWRTVTLVCGKCTRKVGGGFGTRGDTPLAKALRKWAGGGKGRKARAGIVEVPCLKVCPKRAVTVVDAGRPGEWLIVAAGTPVQEVAVRLGMVAFKPLPLEGGVGVGARVCAPEDQPSVSPSSDRGIELRSPLPHPQPLP